MSRIKYMEKNEISLTLEQMKKMSIDEIINAYRNGYRLEDRDLYALSPATCTKTNGIVGEIIHLKATPAGGTPPYTVKFYKDTTLFVTYTGVPEGTQKTFDYTLVSGDVGSRVFKVNIPDSCAGGAKTCEETCTITVTACSVPTCSFIVE